MNDDSISIKPPPAPVPLKTAHELKERTLRDYSRNAGILGMPSDPAEIEKLVVSDLNLSDNYHREEGPPPEPKKASAEERAELQAERLRRDRFRIENRTGHRTTLVRDKPRNLGPALDLPPDIENSPKWKHALGRMARVIQGYQPVFNADNSPNFYKGTRTCEYPDGAYEWLAAWKGLEMRYAPATKGKNPYFGMSHRDASLKFVAETMNICDRSTCTSMGGWWVK